MDFTTVAQNAIAKHLGKSAGADLFLRPLRGRTHRSRHQLHARVERRSRRQRVFRRHPRRRRRCRRMAAGPVQGRQGRAARRAMPTRPGSCRRLDVSHQMYNNIWPSKRPDYMSASYLANKRSNARDSAREGPHRRSIACTRSRGISHSGGENLPDGKRGDIQILDMSKLMDRFIDMLDAWVERGTAPPASRSDGAEPSPRRHAASAGDARDRLPARRLPSVSKQRRRHDGICPVHRARRSSRWISRTSSST